MFNNHLHEQIQVQASLQSIFPVTTPADNTRLQWLVVFHYERVIDYQYLFHFPFHVQTRSCT